jgi:hypothetical protein
LDGPSQGHLGQAHSRPRKAQPAQTQHSLSRATPGPRRVSRSGPTTRNQINVSPQHGRAPALSSGRKHSMKPPTEPTRSETAPQPSAVAPKRSVCGRPVHRN